MRDYRRGKARPRPDGVEAAPSPRRRPTPSTSTPALQPDVVMSDVDAAVLAFAHFADAIGVAVGSPFALPPLWPMVMHAAATRPQVMTVVVWKKVLQRYWGRLTEIDLTGMDDESARSVLDLMSSADMIGACSRVRVLRLARARSFSSVFEHFTLPPLPSLEELHESPFTPLPPSAFPKLRSFDGPCCIDSSAAWLKDDDATYSNLTSAIIVGSDPVAVVALLNRMPNLTTLGFPTAEPGPSNPVYLALAAHPVAARLRSHSVGFSDLGDLVHSFPSLECYRYTARDTAWGEVLTALPLRQLHASTMLIDCRITDFSFLSRIVTLKLDRTCECRGLQDGVASAPIFHAADWSTLPSVLALRHLSIDFGMHSASVAARLVHPLLKTFDIGVSTLSTEEDCALSTVFDALKQHRPQLRVLGLRGVRADCVLDVAGLLSCCGAELRKLNFDVKCPDSYSVPAPTAPDALRALAEHCPKLLELHCNFVSVDCHYPGSGVVHLLQRCRSMEYLCCYAPSLDSEARQRLVSLTAQRKILLRILADAPRVSHVLCTTGGQGLDWWLVGLPWEPLDYRRELHAA